METDAIKAIVEEAVQAAKEGILADVDLKIQRAFEIGAEIGAAKGAEIGARAAVQAVEQERKRYKQARYERQLHDTKLLLQHYRALNRHYKKAVFREENEPQGEDLTFLEVMELMDRRSYGDDIFVKSISDSARTTAVIMRHVNTMLAQYKKMCNTSKRQDDGRRWRVIERLYLLPVRDTAKEVAEAENIDKRTVYKDVDAAVAELTMLLFGAPAIEKL